MKTLLSALLLISIAYAQPYKVLHYTETTGYDHQTRQQSEAMLQSFGSTLNFTLTSDSTSTEFSSLSNLLQYDVVVFANTTGNAGLTASERANFEAYIDSGGSYLGIHAAADAYRHGSSSGYKKGTWDYYPENLSGASVGHNPGHTHWNTSATITQMVSHPILNGIPSFWTKTEEYYYWHNGFLDTSFTELLRVGPTGLQSYDNPRMVAQCKELPGGGKSFYTALGHSKWNYTTDQSFQTLIFNALDWMLPDQVPFSIDEVAIQVRGSLMCWEASEPATITLEIYIPEIQEWQYSVRYHKQRGCHELRGCDPVIVRINAVSEDDGSEVTSEPKEVQPKPFHRLEYGVFKPDCSLGESFSVIDSSGREMMHGMVSSEGINMQGLTPGFYSVIVGENTFTVMR